MGSLFYDEKPAKVEDWTPQKADWDKALGEVARKEQRTLPAATLGSFERADALRQEAEKLEAVLLHELAEGSVKPVDVEAWVAANAPSWFPAKEFARILATNAGGSGKLVDAAKEIVGVASVVGGKGEVG